jgi:hypothetical protein
MKIVRNPAEWQAVRATGKQWFLLRYGVLQRGLPLGIICTAAIQFAMGTRPNEWLETDGFLLRLAMLCALFSVSGSITANATWNLYERKFGAGAPR